MKRYLALSLSFLFFFLSGAQADYQYRIRIKNETLRKIKITAYCSGVKQGSDFFGPSKRTGRDFKSSCSNPMLRIQAKIIDKWNKVGIWVPYRDSDFCEHYEDDSTGDSCGDYRMLDLGEKVSFLSATQSGSKKACFKVREVLFVRAVATRCP